VFGAFSTLTQLDMGLLKRAQSELSALWPGHAKAEDASTAKDSLQLILLQLNNAQAIAVEAAITYSLSSDEVALLSNELLDAEAAEAVPQVSPRRHSTASMFDISQRTTALRELSFVARSLTRLRIEGRSSVGRGSGSFSAPSQPIRLSAFPALQVLVVSGVPVEHIEDLFALRAQLKLLSFEHAALASTAALLGPGAGSCCGSVNAGSSSTHKASAFKVCRNIYIIIYLFCHIVHKLYHSTSLRNGSLYSLLYAYELCHCGNVLHSLHILLIQNILHMRACILHRLMLVL
jgi:hypothetical protein